MTATCPASTRATGTSRTPTRWTASSRYAASTSCSSGCSASPPDSAEEPMFDKYIVCEESFRRLDDGRTGGRVEVRMPYYRGLGLSMVEAVNLTLDGAPVPPERTTFTVHGHTYTFAEMPRVFDDRWEMGERAELAFETDEPLAPGEHDVAVSIRLRISYMPVPGGGAGRKRLTLASEA